MRSVFICDRSFAAREASLLRRLEVGLLDEGIRITRAAPESHAHLLTGGFASTVPYADTGSRFTRRLRSAALYRKLTTSAGPLAETIAEVPIDIVHAFGEECWGQALDLASMSGASLVIEVWSGRLLHDLRELERQATEFTADGGKAIWLAPDNMMQSAMTALGLSWPVMVAPWGVHVPNAPSRDRPKDGLHSIAIITDPRTDPKPMRALLDALSDITRNGKELLAFMNHAVADANPWLWRRADELGLLDTLSVITDIEAQRELVLHADALLLPDPAGDHRSITLDAMASGMLVIAQADPLIDDLIGNRTAYIIHDPTPANWSASLARVLDDDIERTAMANSAREYVRAHRLAHMQVQAVLAAYQSVAEAPIAFPPGG